MNTPSSETVARLREQYPPGTRVELVRMNDSYSRKLKPGCRGTVQLVDSIGTVHVAWDCGSSLGVVYGEDEIRIVEGGCDIHEWRDSKHAAGFESKAACR